MLRIYRQRQRQPQPTRQRQPQPTRQPQPQPTQQREPHDSRRHRPQGGANPVEPKQKPNMETFTNRPPESSSRADCRCLELPQLARQSDPLRCVQMESARSL